MRLGHPPFQVPGEGYAGINRKLTGDSPRQNPTNRITSTVSQGSDPHVPLRRVDRIRPKLRTTLAVANVVEIIRITIVRIDDCNSICQFAARIVGIRICVINVECT